MSKKVLVVDDSSTVRDQLRRVLEPAGFCVVDAQDGVEGLERVAAQADLSMIICDVHMPRMNGIEMIRALREGGRQVPILMLTTEGQPDLIRQAKQAGARGWIVKPFDGPLLVRAVESLCA